MNDRLYRSVDDRVIAGVCGGLAVRLGMDPSLVRIGYVLLALVTGLFPLVVLYVIMAAVVPEEPTGFAGVGRSPTPPGPDAIPGWASPTTEPWPAAAGQPATGSAPASDAGAAGSSPGATAPAWPPPPAPALGAAPGANGWERRARRDRDPVLAVAAGLVLIGLGVYFLVRDQLTIRWDVVWPVAIVALGLVVVLAALRPRT
ncbi:MAG: PspC domain-containing protein [Chloroflexi bacterium]|nr:PspC domain-containing protein [Chloroflexota bacterium]